MCLGGSVYQGVGLAFHRRWLRPWALHTQDNDRTPSSVSHMRSVCVRTNLPSILLEYSTHKTSSSCRDCKEQSRFFRQNCRVAHWFSAPNECTYLFGLDEMPCRYPTSQVLPGLHLDLLAIEPTTKRMNNMIFLLVYNISTNLTRPKGHTHFWSISKGVKLHWGLRHSKGLRVHGEIDQTWDR